MYHYNPKIALEELVDDAILPNPVNLRDMILRQTLSPEQSLELNRSFVEYQEHFAKAQKLAKLILQQLAG